MNPNIIPKFETKLLDLFFKKILIIKSAYRKSQNCIREYK